MCLKHVASDVHNPSSQQEKAKGQTGQLYVHAPPLQARSLCETETYLGISLLLRAE